jgi:hypothetical protein
MDGPKASATPNEADREAPEAKDLKIGPGIGTLLNGAKPVESEGQRQTGPTGAPVVRSKLTLLKRSLLAADLALVGLAVFLMLSASQARTPLRIGMCIGALGLGAWLGCLAFWWKPDAEERGSGDPTAQPDGNESENQHR